MKKNFWILFLLILLFAADQSFKLFFIEKSACNENIAWSLSAAPGVFYPIWTVVFLLLAYQFARAKNHGEKIALAIILCGAISNMFDRLVRGCVVDFIDLKFWPVFNLADIYITIGAVLLFASYAKILDTKY